MNCPNCGEETVESALIGYEKCMNDKCKYFQDRVIKDGRSCIG